MRTAFVRKLLSIQGGGLSSPPPELRATAPSLRVLAPVATPAPASGPSDLDAPLAHQPGEPVIDLQHRRGKS